MLREEKKKIKRKEKIQKQCQDVDEPKCETDMTGKLNVCQN